MGYDLRFLFGSGRRSDKISIRLTGALAQWYNTYVGMGDVFMQRLRALLHSDQFREIFVYGVVGVLTTVINYAVYFAASRGGAALTGLPYDHAALVSFATAVAWVAAVAFAFWANKVFVFKSPGWNRKVLSRELPGFVSARLLSLAFDWAFVLLAVKLAGMNDLVAKLISNIVVIVLNYFASKFWIFRKR